MQRATLALVLLIVTPAVWAEEMVTSLVCTSNSRAWRDYSFLATRWEGPVGSPTPTYGIVSRDKPSPSFPLRDKVFSALNTRTPVIRSITPPTKNADERAEEFVASVLLRSGSEIFLTWNNGINKVWTAVVDIANKKAVVTNVFRGATSTGGEIETLDCR
jgi:hypothetical protein